MNNSYFTASLNLNWNLFSNDLEIISEYAYDSAHKFAISYSFYENKLRKFLKNIGLSEMFKTTNKEALQKLYKKLAGAKSNHFR